MDRIENNRLHWIRASLPWIIFITLCCFAFVGCFQAKPPGASLSYDPLTQLGESVKGTNWLVTVSY